MLRILTGSDRVVLTEEILSRIIKNAENKSSGQILIVPEQYSHEAEKMLCRSGGDTISRFAEVLSFSRLSDRLAAVHGGIARPYLDKGGQLLMMALAAEQVISKIKLFAAVVHKPEFLADMLRIINEFRSYCLQPQQLLEAAAEEEGLFAQKLEEIGLLYEAYLAVCRQGIADPSDKLYRLTEHLLESQWTRDKTVFLDGFSDFTGSELAVIEGLLLSCRDVVISATGGVSGTLLENLAGNTVLQLCRMADSKGIPHQVTVVDRKARRHSDVQYLLDHMLLGDSRNTMESDRISVLRCDSVEDACRSAAVHVKELLSSGARCREICIACADPAAYEAPIRAAFRAAGLPVYLAGERNLISLPVMASVRNALGAAVGYLEYESAAVYLKSGLPMLERDRCDRLDNYGYRWNIRGNQWFTPWENHPRGFAEAWTEEDRSLLAQLEHDRLVAMTPVQTLRNGLYAAKNTGEMVLALHDFLESLNLQERLEEEANRQAGEGHRQNALELSQMYETLCVCLEQIWLTIGQTRRSPEEFFRLFELLLTQYQIATIPAALDQVLISSLPDLRYKKTKHLLVLGANDGSMPSYHTADSLLSEDERKKLILRGLSLAPTKSEQIEREIAQIHSAFSAAEQSCWISYTGDQPAWLVRRIRQMFPGSARTEEEEVFLRMDDLAAWRVRTGDRSELDLDGLAQMESKLDRLRKYRFDPLQTETVQKLYGTPIMLSPSKIDSYSSCRLSYFLNYGLKAKSRKQAKLDQPAFGTFVHAVLEHTVLRVMDLGGFEEISRDRVLEIADEEIAGYAAEYFPAQAERDQYLFQRAKTEIREIVDDLWRELRCSRFRPAFCELKFGGDGKLPLIPIRGSRLESRITGLVDRVDLYRDSETTYVRIVDYKTGSKNFDYTDILHGNGLQMLIYLFALRSFGAQSLGTDALEPAGVLYLPARKEYPLTEPMPQDFVVESEHQKIRRRKGLIRSDSHLLAAMEADPDDPHYMPYKVGRKGYSGDLADKHQMDLLEHHVIKMIETMTDQIAEGGVSPNPMVRGPYSPCSYCDYHAVCHKDTGTQEQRILSEISSAEFWSKLEQEG